MGCFVSDSSPRERISARWREGKRAQGSEHWWYVSYTVDGWRRKGMQMQILTDPTEGELLDLVEEFSEGRIQFAFVKVKLSWISE